MKTRGWSAMVWLRPHHVKRRLEDVVFRREICGGRVATYFFRIATHSITSTTPGVAAAELDASLDWVASRKKDLKPHGVPSSRRLSGLFAQV